MYDLSAHWARVKIVGEQVRSADQDPERFLDVLARELAALRKPCRGR